MDLCLGFGCSSVWLCRALFHLSFTAVTLGWIASYDLLLLYLKKKILNTPHCSFASYVTAIVWEWQTLTTNMSNKKTTQTHKWISDFSSFDCAMHVKCNGQTQADQSIKMINSYRLVSPLITKLWADSWLEVSRRFSALSLQTCGGSKQKSELLNRGQSCMYLFIC